MKNFYAVVFGMLLLLGVGIFVGYTLKMPQINTHKIQEEALTLITKESKASFLVTGKVDLVLEYTLSDKKEMMGLDLGTTQTEIRIPGEAFYGFSADKLTLKDFKMQGDTLILFLPPTEVLTVSPNLAKMQMKTDVGWARLYKNSGRSVEQKALKSIPDRMKAKAVAYVQNSPNAQQNTKKAIEQLMIPLLRSNGVQNPKIWIAPTINNEE
jgi:Protein of unknown function (DUF4230)